MTIPDFGRWTKLKYDPKHIEEAKQSIETAKEAIDYINKTRKELNAFRNTKAYKSGVKTARDYYKQWAKNYHKIGRKMGTFEKEIQEGSKVLKADKNSRAIGAAACVLYCATYAIDDIVDASTLYANACNGEKYIQLFSMLAESSDEEIRDAAQYITVELRGGWDAVWETIGDCSGNVVKAFGVFTLHSKLAGLGWAGPIIEAALIIFSALIIRDACSVRVNNSINVGLAHEIDSAISRMYGSPHLGYNDDGEMIAAFTVEENKDYTNYYIFNAFAQCYAEREYLRYLNQNRWLIYKTNSSKSEATRNITELNNIICKYFNCEIPISKQTDVK